MKSFFSPETMARRSSRRPKTAILIWVVALILGLVLFGSLLDRGLTTEFNFTNNPESKRADELVEDRLRGERQLNEIVVIQSDSLTVDDARYRSVVTDLFSRITPLQNDDGEPIIDSGISFFTTGDEALVSAANRSITIMPLVMAGAQDDARDNITFLHDELDAFETPSGFTIKITGEATIGDDFQTISQEDLQTGELLFGIPLAIIILILVFGALVAAAIPVIIALVSILISLGIAALLGLALELNFFIVNFIFMIGLAVGIDYSLFIIQRYREERAKGREKLDAIQRSSATAGRAVLFSGVTVVLALVGMVIVPNNIFQSLGAGAIVVVIVSVLGSMTLVPAILSLLGDRINKGKIPFVTSAQEHFDEENLGGFWDRVSRAVMARPIISFVLAAGLLLAATSAYFTINTGFAGVSTFPDDLESKQAFLVLDEHFEAGQISPIEIVIDGPIDNPAVMAGIERLRSGIEEDIDYGPTTLEFNDARDLALISSPLLVPDDTNEATEAIKRLRREIIPANFAGAPAEALVGGLVAGNVDFFRMASDSITPVFAFVLGMSFLLLLLVFRSIIVPIKAVILNLLSVGAAYGLLVLVFQEGWAHGFFGFTQVETIEAWIPLFLFSVLFGLSMDYHVFLMSRIRERFDQTGDNTGSVAFGIRSTGRLITGAALIMVAVFGGFASGSLVPLEQMGFGLGAAVLIDATIIRSILVPAAMKMLGKWNWYLPNWLNWLPDLRVEADHPVAQGAAPEPEGQR